MLLQEISYDLVLIKGVLKTETFIFGSGVEQGGK